MEVLKPGIQGAVQKASLLLAQQAQIKKLLQQSDAKDLKIAELEAFVEVEAGLAEILKKKHHCEEALKEFDFLVSKRQTLLKNRPSVQNQKKVFESLRDLARIRNQFLEEKHQSDFEARCQVVVEKGFLALSHLGLETEDLMYSYQSSLDTEAAFSSQFRIISEFAQNRNIQEKNSLQSFRSIITQNERLLKKLMDTSLMTTQYQSQYASTFEEVLHQLEVQQAFQQRALNKLEDILQQKNPNDWESAAVDSLTTDNILYQQQFNMLKQATEKQLLEFEKGIKENENKLKADLAKAQREAMINKELYQDLKALQQGHWAGFQPDASLQSSVIPLGKSTGNSTGQTPHISFLVAELLHDEASLKQHLSSLYEELSNKQSMAETLLSEAEKFSSLAEKYQNKNKNLVKKCRKQAQKIDQMKNFIQKLTACAKTPLEDLHRVFFATENLGQSSIQNSDTHGLLKTLQTLQPQLEAVHTELQAKFNIYQSIADRITQTVKSLQDSVPNTSPNSNAIKACIQIMNEKVSNLNSKNTEIKSQIARREQKKLSFTEFDSVQTQVCQRDTMEIMKSQSFKMLLTYAPTAHIQQLKQQTQNSKEANWLRLLETELKSRKQTHQQLTLQSELVNLRQLNSKQHDQIEQTQLDYMELQTLNEELEIKLTGILADFEEAKKKNEDQRKELRVLKNKNMIWNQLSTKYFELFTELNKENIKIQVAELIKNKLDLLVNYENDDLEPTRIEGTSRHPRSISQQPKRKITQDSFINHLLRNPAMLQYHIESMYQQIQQKEKEILGLENQIEIRQKRINKVLQDNRRMRVRELNSREEESFSERQPRRRLTIRSGRPSRENSFLSVYEESQCEDTQKSISNTSILRKMFGVLKKGKSALDLGKNGDQKSMQSASAYIDLLLFEFQLMLKQDSIIKFTKEIKEQISVTDIASKTDLEIGLTLFQDKVSIITSQIVDYLQNLPQQLKQAEKLKKKIKDTKNNIKQELLEPEAVNLTFNNITAQIKSLQDSLRLGLQTYRSELENSQKMLKNNLSVENLPSDLSLLRQIVKQLYSDLATNDQKLELAYQMIDQMQKNFKIIESDTEGVWERILSTSKTMADLSEKIQDFEQKIEPKLALDFGQIKKNLLEITNTIGTRDSLIKQKQKQKLNQSFSDKLSYQGLAGSSPLIKLLYSRIRNKDQSIAKLTVQKLQLSKSELPKPKIPVINILTQQLTMLYDQIFSRDKSIASMKHSYKKLAQQIQDLNKTKFSMQQEIQSQKSKIQHLKVHTPRTIQTKTNTYIQDLIHRVPQLKKEPSLVELNQYLIDLTSSLSDITLKNQTSERKLTTALEYQQSLQEIITQTARELQFVTDLIESVQAKESVRLVLSRLTQLENDPEDTRTPLIQQLEQLFFQLSLDFNPSCPASCIKNLATKLENHTLFSKTPQKITRVRSIPVKGQRQSVLSHELKKIQQQLKKSQKQKDHFHKNIKKIQRILSQNDLESLLAKASSQKSQSFVSQQLKRGAASISQIYNLVEDDPLVYSGFSTPNSITSFRIDSGPISCCSSPPSEQQTGIQVTECTSPKSLDSIKSVLQRIANESEKIQIKNENMQGKINYLKTEFGTQNINWETQKQMIQSDLKRLDESDIDFTEFDQDKGSTRILMYAYKYRLNRLHSSFAKWKRSKAPVKISMIPAQVNLPVLSSGATKADESAARTAILEEMSLIIRQNPLMTEFHDYSKQASSPMQFLQVFQLLEDITQSKLNQDLNEIVAETPPKGYPGYVLEYFEKKFRDPKRSLKSFLVGLKQLAEQGHPYSVFFCCLLQIFHPHPISYSLSIYLTRLNSKFLQLVEKTNKMKESLSKRPYKNNTDFEYASSGGSALLIDVISFIYQNFDKHAGTFILERLCPEHYSYKDYVAFLICHKLQEQQKYPHEIFSKLNKPKASSISAYELIRVCQGDFDIWVSNSDIFSVFSNKEMKQSEFCSWISLNTFVKNQKNLSLTVSKCKFFSIIVEYFNYQQVRDGAFIFTILNNQPAQTFTLPSFKKFLTYFLKISVEQQAIDQIFAESQKRHCTSELSKSSVCMSVLNYGLGGYGLGSFVVKAVYDMFAPSVLRPEVKVEESKPEVVIKQKETSSSSKVSIRDRIMMAKNPKQTRSKPESRKYSTKRRVK